LELLLLFLAFRVAPLSLLFLPLFPGGELSLLGGGRSSLRAAEICLDRSEVEVGNPGLGVVTEEGGGGESPCSEERGDQGFLCPG
jgi:hypothetical protein